MDLKALFFNNNKYNIDILTKLFLTAQTQRHSEPVLGVGHVGLGQNSEARRAE